MAEIDEKMKMFDKGVAAGFNATIVLIEEVAKNHPDHEARVVLNECKRRINQTISDLRLD